VRAADAETHADVHQGADGHLRSDADAYPLMRAVSLSFRTLLASSCVKEPTGVSSDGDVAP
jgi:hypothetical protein